MFLQCPASLKPVFVPLQPLNFLQGSLCQIEIDDKVKHFEIIKGICFSFSFFYHRMKMMKSHSFFHSNYVPDFSNFMRAVNSL